MRMVAPAEAKDLGGIGNLGQLRLLLLGLRSFDGIKRRPCGFSVVLQGQIRDIFKVSNLAGSLLR